MTLGKKPFKNIVGKGEKAGNQHFSPFTTMFSKLLTTNFNFLVTSTMSSANAFNFEQAKILSVGKELMHLCDDTLSTTMCIYASIRSILTNNQIPNGTEWSPGTQKNDQWQNFSTHVSICLSCRLT